MPLTRRQFIKTSGAAGLVLTAPSVLVAASKTEIIDRRAVVRRHNPVVTRFDPFAALSVGNGEFAFTADVTGLQTFVTECETKFPLCTLSHWGWHTTPHAGLRREDLRYKEFDVYGRKVGYATDAKGQETLFNWLRQNPHRLHLGRIGFDLKKPDGSRVRPEDLSNVRQTLDLWTGLLESSFEFGGAPVRVQTCCHPELDLIAARVESPLLDQGRMQVLIAFPAASPEMSTAEWNKPALHTTTFHLSKGNRARFERKLDDTEYEVNLAWSDGGKVAQVGTHEFGLAGGHGGILEFACHFSPKAGSSSLPSFAKTRAASEAHWKKFWTTGGAIDLGASTDTRAPELERRVVLSLYNTAVHCAGSLPSAETGLLYNSWYGKFHLEMHWWHSVHFTAWNRFHLFEKSLAIYPRILPIAREIARRQGYRGARWPKMIGPDGYDSPSPVGPLLIWQQPHPIYYAELCYRERPTAKTLQQWRDIVFETAEFMASYAVRIGEQDEYVLGPPMKTVSENADTLTTRNPTFELAYWRFGLRVAQAWRERLGLPRSAAWDNVLTHLAPPSMQDGLYLMQEGMTDTYMQWNWEHPALIGAFGMQPGDGVDAATMRHTLSKVMQVWQWDRAWGWDFPMTAMCAARTEQPELAVRALLIDSVKNRYHPNGHNYQRENLTAYLPGNGGLLAATAMMAAGWTNGPTRHAPGFPDDGKWSVKFENLKRWI